MVLFYYMFKGFKFCVLCIQSGKADGGSGRNLNFRWVAMELSDHLHQDF